MLFNLHRSVWVLVDVQEKLTTLVQGSDRLVEHCAWVMRLAQELQAATIVSEHYPKGLGRTLPSFLEGVTPSFHFEKTAFSLVSEPGVWDSLESFHGAHWVLCGIETHVCVLQTALDLKARGQSVFVVRDAVSSRSCLDHEAALIRMSASGVQCITREMLLFEALRTASHQDFKRLSSLFIARDGSSAQ